MNVAMECLKKKQQQVKIELRVTMLPGTI